MCAYVRITWNAIKMRAGSDNAAIYLYVLILSGTCEQFSMQKAGDANSSRNKIRTEAETSKCCQNKG